MEVILMVTLVRALHWACVLNGYRFLLANTMDTASRFPISFLNIQYSFQKIHVFDLINILMIITHHHFCLDNLRIKYSRHLN